MWRARLSPSYWLRGLEASHPDTARRTSPAGEECHSLSPSLPVSVEAPVQACYRYISDQPGQFDYRSALEAGLPFLSGEVESGHRYEIQDRPKIGGAWWKRDPAEKMLALRVVRVNNDWEAYWQHPRKKAA